MSRSCTSQNHPRWQGMAGCLSYLLYWPVFGVLFFCVERVWIRDSYYPVSCPLDALIPFCEYFIFPYLFWFVFLAGMQVYALFREPAAFKKMMRFIMLTYTAAIIIYLVFPNCQQLRPVVFARDLQRNKLYFVLSLLVMALTLRSKSLAFCIVAPAIAYVMRDGRKLNAIHVIICVMVAALIGWDQFVGYYQTDGSARGELTVASVEIAMDHFPLGTGFATFGSNTSASGGYYSPVYYAYELDTVWGLSPENHSFLSDTFWPIVLGQFGFLGLAIYILMLFSVAMLAFREGKATRVCVVLCFTYLIISSTSASSFFNPMSVYLAFLLGLLVAAFRGQNIPSGCEEEPALSTGEDCRV